MSEKWKNKTVEQFLHISTPCNAYGILKPLVLKLFCKTWLLYLQKISVVHLKYFMKVLPKMFRLHFVLFSFVFLYSILFHMFLLLNFDLRSQAYMYCVIMNKYLTCGKWILQCNKLSAFVTTCLLMNLT